MRRASTAVSIVLLWSALGSRAADSPCVSCHREQGHLQPATDMASALLLPESNRVLQEHPKLSTQRAGYSYTVETAVGRSTYTVTNGKESMSLPIRWSFGDRSQTWVFERNGRFYESLVSYYPAVGGLDTTIGDASIQPHTLLEAAGRELSDFETRSCFGCHATAAVTGDKLTLDGMTAGVQCERCHQGGDRHFAAISQGKTAPVPAKLKALTPEEMSNFCGQCHRTWERVVRDRLRGPINVRFQPYRLANSKCYDGGDPRMSCTACHDPHKQVVRGAEAYDAKCAACHSGDAKACPIAKAACANCHMPKVELPGGHMTFTDHDIRIVRPGDPYPN